jgi:hypothetical protein
VVEILLSVEMINESANLVPAENHLKAKEMALIEEGRHCVSLVLEDDREEVRIVVLSERGIGLRNERQRPGPLMKGERFFCQSKLNALRRRVPRMPHINTFSHLDNNFNFFISIL